MTAESPSTRQRLPGELMSKIYVGRDQILEATEDWLHYFHTSDSVLMAPVSLSLDAPQNPLVWLGIPPPTQLSETERSVSRSKVEKWK